MSLIGIQSVYPYSLTGIQNITGTVNGSVPIVSITIAGQTFYLSASLPDINGNVVLTLNIATANTSTTGLLSDTDWNTFNGKENVLTFTSPLRRIGNTIDFDFAQNLTFTGNLTFNGGNNTLNNNTFIGGPIFYTGATVATTPDILFYNTSTGLITHSSSPFVNLLPLNNTWTGINTFNNSVNINALLTVNATPTAMSVLGDTYLNDNGIYFRAIADTNHGMEYNATFDCPRMFGNAASVEMGRQLGGVFTRTGVFGRSVDVMLLYRNSVSFPNEQLIFDNNGLFFYIEQGVAIRWSLDRNGDASFRNLNLRGDGSINGNGFLEFGAGVVKDINAGLVAYQRFSGNLDIVGAGLTGNPRSVRIWDKLGINDNVGATETFRVGGISALNGPTYMSDNILALRGVGDNNHGIVYNGTVDGPQIFGFGGIRFAKQSLLLQNMTEFNTILYQRHSDLNSAPDNGQCAFNILQPNSANLAIGLGVDTNFRCGYINVAEIGIVRTLFLNTRANANVCVTGRFSVGVFNGAYPLEVVGGVGFFFPGGGWTHGGGAGTVGAFNASVSIRSNNDMLAPRFIAPSDIRIKKNIQHLDDVEALEIIRNIEPTTYEYIDDITRGKKRVIGFIAQQVKEVLPYAVQLEKQLIPSFMTKCNVNKTEMDNVVIVTTPIDISFNAYHDASGNEYIDENGFPCSDASGNKNFKVHFYDCSNTLIDCETIAIIDKRNFLIDITATRFLDCSGDFIGNSGTYTDASGNIVDYINEYFLQGQVIDDFNVLDKNAIFTTAVAALQEIDRQQVKDKLRIQELENKVDKLEQENTMMKDIIERLTKIESTLLRNKSILKY